MVVTQRNVFTCALYLAGTLSLVAFLFLLLNADFLAAVQILLYVGGILVILAFAIMLSSIPQSKIQSQVNEQWIPSLLVAGALFLVIVQSLKESPFPNQTQFYAPTTASLGRLLLTDMVLPFEVVSLVLLASLVGAVYFSKKRNVG